MNIPVIHWWAILPIAVLSFFGIAVMVLDPFLKPASRGSLGWLALIGVAAAAGAVPSMAQHPGASYSGL